MMHKSIATLAAVLIAAGLPIAVSQAASASCVTYPAYSTGPDSCSGGFSTVNIWFPGGGVGLEGQEIWTYGNGVPSSASSMAFWTIGGLSAHQAYEVEAYIPNEHSDATSAHYEMWNGAGAFQGNGYVNQENYTNAWANVGAACSDGTIRTRVDDSNTSIYLEIGADALRVVRTGHAC